MRIPVTALESFRCHLHEVWLSEGDLINQLAHRAPPTPALLLGRAFDSILSAPLSYQVPGGYSAEGYSFSDEDMALAFAALDRRIVWQVKTAKVWDDLPEKPTIVAKADGILGQRLIENKTTTGSFDFSHYERSYQWRFYLDLFDANVIEYHVFRLNDHGNGVVEVKDVESFTLYRYPSLHDDCTQLLSMFLDFVKVKRLELYFEERTSLEV